MRLPEPAKAARRAGLCYVTDCQPGITRKRRGKSFIYTLPSGKILKDPRTLARIKSLVIPPAWERVWICPRADGHIQATGLDVRGRKQYRYHSQWSIHRNLAKFATLVDFGSALPAIRSRIDRDLRRPGMPREKVAACVVHLMDQTAIRIGNSAYARDNDSYGLSTILNKHAKVAGAEIRFRFHGKGGRQCDLSVESPRVARIVRACQELPGQELFCYIDEQGQTRDIGSGDINEYLASISGETFTAKDFRTWSGTCAAALALAELGLPEDEGQPLSNTALKRREFAAIRAASEVLNNTVSVCRKFYVHPELITAYADGRLHQAFERAASVRTARLSRAERAVLILFRRASAAKSAA